MAGIRCARCLEFGKQAIDRLDRVHLQHNGRVEGDLVEPVHDGGSGVRRHAIAVECIDQDQHEIRRMVQQRRSAGLPR